ncbi:MAG: hypothetical protein IT373_21645 [Polyangiaceae bacterium]|nr:hypothetical protein [Polyangiaceae bacterium]
MRLASPFHPLAAALLSLTALGGAAGCAASKDQLSEELTKLQTEVARLRAESITLGDRLEALEQGAPADGARSSSDGAGKPAGEPRPSLAVVRLTPLGAEAAGGAGPAPEDESVDEPRPLLRGDGRGATIETVGPGDKAATAPKSGGAPGKSGSGAK